MRSYTLDQLATQGRALDAPFQVHLPDDADGLECLQVLRLLPGKRLACRARHGGREVLAKLFYDPAGWQRHLEREATGCEALIAAQVPTPAIVRRGSGESGGWLLFRFLAGAVSLEAQWAACAGEEDRLRVLECAMEAVAGLHNAGLYQEDIHLGNFLLDDGVVYCVDGASVRSGGSGPLAGRVAVENLGLLVAQLYPHHEVLAWRAVAAYRQSALSARGFTDLELQAAIVRQRRLRARHFESKLFRTCTQFHSEHDWRRFAVVERADLDDELQAWLRRPDAAFEGSELLKDGNSATVCRMRLRGRQVVVKRYNIKSFWHGVLRALQPSRAWVSWRNGHMLRHFGLPTPRPVAMLEQRWGWLRSRAWLVTEAADGPHALEYLAREDLPDDQLQRAVGGIRDIFLGMIATRFSHGDLKATNILMAPEGPVLIDLDAARRHRDVRSFAEAFRKDLARFQRNWPPGGAAERAFSPLVREMEELVAKL